MMAMWFYNAYCQFGVRPEHAASSAPACLGKQCSTESEDCHVQMTDVSQDTNPTPLSPDSDKYLDGWFRPSLGKWKKAVFCISVIFW